MRRPLIALVISGLALLSACTDDAPESGSRTGSTESVGEDKRLELAEENFVEEISSAQLEAGTVHVVTTTSIGGQDFSVEADVALSDDPTDSAAALSMGGSAGGESVDLRAIGRMMYVNLGEATGGEFYRADLADGGEAIGNELAGVLDQADPLAQFEVLGDSVTAFTTEGDGGEIDGVSTTRYIMAVDPAAMYESQGLDPETLVELPKAVDYVLYVGVDLLPRRMEVEVPGVGASTVEWSKWGESVVIEAPDEDQITDEAPAGFAQS